MQSSRRSRSRLLALPLAVSLAVVVAPLSAGAVSAAAAEADHPQLLGLTHYTGELHSHTGLTYTESPGNLPSEVFKQIQDTSDLDFYAATEKAGAMDVTNADAFIDDIDEAESKEWKELYKETDAWNAAGNDLVGVPGQEVSWANLHSGHINVFNAQWLLAAEATGAGWTDSKSGGTEWDLPAFYARLKEDPAAIAQFNHPSNEAYGTFDTWHHLDRQLDSQIEMFEYKQNDAEYLQNWHDALDAGWHVAPTWNGDEHGKSFNDNPARTGIWATEKSLDGLYDAMHRRSLYASFDENATLALTANGSMMGSILPSDTTKADVELQLGDVDDADAGGTVTIYGNGGEVLYAAPYLGHDTVVSTTLDVEDGDWFYARVDQADGDLLVSAPLWVGDTVSGADYAPQLQVPGERVRTANPGELVQLPTATATDDSGVAPVISMEVFTGQGLVPVTDGAFRIQGFDDHIVVIKATDANGNIGSELVRYTVDQDGANPEDVFRHTDIANVGEKPGEAAISVTTDQRIEQAWVQVRPVGGSWDAAITQPSTGRAAFDVERQGRPGAYDDWQKVVTGEVLRNHEFRLTGLKQGVDYEYRFALDPADGWTGVRGQFEAAGFDDSPIYVLGDLQVEDDSAAGYAVFPETLKTLKDKAPGGDLLVQTGDLVNFGGYYHQWKDSFDLALNDIDLEYAGIAGNHETQRDPEKNDKLEIKRDSIYSGMFANPLNGAVGESNYSFDHGDIHISVINSMYDMDAQLRWLQDDMRASDKTWKVVVGHFSYYGGEHAADANLVLDRGKITPVLQKLGVDLYIGGHDHIYKRSTMYDGHLAENDEQTSLGTTYVTMGSSGPKFYDNTAYPWDDVVFDEDTQVGMALKADDKGLQFTTYTIDGRTVDDYTITQPQDHWEVSSADIRDGELAGVGVTSYPGSRTDPITVSAVVYDAAQQAVVELRSAEVTLRQTTGEQYVAFDEPIKVDPRTTIKILTWDSLGDAEPLKPPLTVLEGMAGSGTESDPYQLRTVNDLRKISNDLSAQYLLMNDVVWDDVERETIAGSADTPFTGVLDGGGHSIRGIVASNKAAVGLIGWNAGTIRNLGIEDANVIADARVGGILATTNTGVIERVHTTGAIADRARVGGIVGDQQGVVRDSWSTASVTAQTRVGGIVGSAMLGSVTERNWFGGAVTTTDLNAGGITGWSEAGSTVQDNVMLGGSLSGKNGQAIAGNVDAGGILDNNYRSSEAVIGGPQRSGVDGPGTIKGAPVDAAAAATADFFTTQLGWDLSAVWLLDAATGRPILVSREG